MIAKLDRGRFPVRYFYLKGPKRTIGYKRNFACEQARGEIIAHQDDDDWYAPVRIDTQTFYIMKENFSVSGVSAGWFVSADGKTYSFQGSYWNVLGASLVYTKTFWIEHPFKAIDEGEDTEFIRAAIRARTLDSIVWDNLLVASIHTGNTSRRRLDDSTYRRVDGPPPGTPMPCAIDESSVG